MSKQSFKPAFLGVFVSLLLLATSSVSAVETFRTSNIAGGRQLWFEVEDFDERDPDDESSFALSDEPGAFGRSISSINGNDGASMIRYTFDISKAGGAGGTWYFWGRVKNPNNNSDFMLVDGHPGDQVPFTLPVSGLVNGQRIFEQSGRGPDWHWAPAGSAGEESHTKTLKDGENTMYVLNRESGAIWDVFMWTDDPAYVPTDADYINAVVFLNGFAANPMPATGVTDVPYYANVLTWSAGDFAVTRSVYFSQVFDDVDNASPAARVAEGITETTLEVPTTDLETTYYWRVDEVNGAPDFTVFPGNVWSFTVESVANLIENVTATADSQFNADTGPDNVVNGSGLTDGLHGSNVGDMWQSAALPATIEFVFDNVYVLHEMHVWNQNQLIEGLLGFGAKDVVLEVSANGSDFVVMEGVGPFNRAPGAAGYAANTIVAFNGTQAKAVRLTITSNYGPLANVGLSEVQFTAIPVFAREPQPADGATDVGVDTTLGWRSGRQVDRHELHLGTDPNDLPQIGSFSENEFNALALDLQLGQTYTWRVDEVNDATDPSIRMGDVWSFTTADNIVVDDMEGYRDEEFLEIWATWIDGFGDPANNGALVGANPSAGDYAPERGLVHGGNQSLPIWFDNGTAAISEATRTFNQAQNWTRSGIQTLSLFVYKGDDNSGGDLYLKINNSKVPLVDNSTYPAGYNPGWVQYHIDLTRLDVSNVSSLTIGVEGPGAQGVIYVDNMRLYAVAPALATLVSPVGSVIEAESGAITAPFEVMSDRPEASGGQYIHTDESVGNSNNDPPARDNGWAVYTINIPADGNYQIAFRGAELDSDSFWVNIPGMVVNDDDLDDSGFVRSNGMFSGPEFVWDFVRDDVGVGTDPIVFTLTAGQHELQIARREDGTALDAIWIFAVD